VTTVTELREHIPVTTPQGPGHCFLIESGGVDQWWTVGLLSGAVITIPQDKVLLARSYSYGRGITDGEMRGIIAKATGTDVPNDPIAMLMLCGELGGMRPGETPASYLRRLIDEVAKYP
jgi:hypothetical protein